MVKQKTKIQTNKNSIKGNRILIFLLQYLHVPLEIKKPMIGSNSG